MALLRSLLFSVLASALATVIARCLLAVSEPPAVGERPRSRPTGTLVIVVPILVGNSNNRIGWVKEVHHHHHHLFGRSGN